VASFVAAEQIHLALKKLAARFVVAMQTIRPNSRHSVLSFAHDDFRLFLTSAISGSPQNRNHKSQKMIALHEDY
jgi:hypothetical protein